MRKDPTEFRERFKRWKAGERVYDSGYATPTMKEESDYRAWKETLPVNLLSEFDYNLRRAYQLGYKPELQDDGYYHLPTRDEKTGEILKGDFHPTLLEGLAIDNDLGYIPIRKNGKYYTKSWLEYKSVPAYEDGKSPGEPEEDPYQVLQRYKGTSHDLSKDAREFTDSDFDVLMNMWGLTEEQEVKKYFHSYVNSPGFDRILKNQKSWWENRHPIRKILPFLFYNDSAELLKNRVNDYWDETKVFSIDMAPSHSFYSPRSNNAYVGNWPQYTYDGNLSTFHGTLGHEYAHGMLGWTPYKGIQEEVLNLNTNTNLSNSSGTNEHDSDNGEKHADIWGLKYLLFKEGIYDSRLRKNALPEHIQKLRLKYPKLRPLRQMDDKKAAWMLNHVAKNTTNYDSIT